MTTVAACAAGRAVVRPVPQVAVHIGKQGVSPSPTAVAETRCEWTVATLRVFEALRLYAASHDGQWPDRLSDITEVPIPLNPFDGKPFVYQRHGNKAFLTSVKGPGMCPGATKSH